MNCEVCTLLTTLCFASDVFYICFFQKVAKAAAVDRLTDSTKYTGSHKERFDDSGKGKGKAGREEIPDTSGYVSAYKGSGSYEDKVKNP